MATESRTPWKTLLRDVMITLRKAYKACDFIYEYRLWQEMNSYKWLIKGVTVAFIIFGFYSFSEFWDNYQSISDSDPSFLHAASGAVSNTLRGISELFLTGSLKYLALILVEVVIFHFVRRTLMIITGDFFDTSFNSFVKAQIRMIKVSFHAFFMEMFYGILIKIAVAFFPIDYVQPVLLFLVAAFFIGYAIVDNYNEVYHMTIRQSAKYSYQYAGITITVGMIVYLLIAIPYIGYVIGPLIGAVIAALSMHAVTTRDDDMEWVYIKKKKKKQIME